MFMHKLTHLGKAKVGRIYQTVLEERVDRKKAEKEEKNAKKENGQIKHLLGLHSAAKIYTLMCLEFNLLYETCDTASNIQIRTGFAFGF